MNTYEKLQEEACKDGIDVIDYPFKSKKIKGLYCDGTIAIKDNIARALLFWQPPTVRIPLTRLFFVRAVSTAGSP